MLHLFFPLTEQLTLAVCSLYPLVKTMKVVLRLSGYWPDRKNISDFCVAHSGCTFFYMYTYRICARQSSDIYISFSFTNLS